MAAECGHWSTQLVAEALVIALGMTMRTVRLLQGYHSLLDREAMRDQGYIPNVTPLIPHKCQKEIRLYPERYDRLL